MNTVSGNADNGPLAQDPSEVPTEALRACGYEPEDIKLVINTHLHWDHCCGNTAMRGGRSEAALPRAQYFASRGEWEHAHERLIRDELRADQTGAFLVWGEPALYDGTLRIIEQVLARLDGVADHLCACDWERRQRGRLRGRGLRRRGGSAAVCPVRC